ncbi:hypothetical protein ACIPY6_39210 [Streptomyces sp. NPDC090054]|uniref:hypothetical protein n=1 Tax=Streptomyces sp. NPDC090054 TaxID=3365933 RepID=UPI0037F61FAC
MSHGLSDQAAAVLSAIADKAPEAFAATVLTLTVITAAHEQDTLPTGATPTDRFGDVHDLPVPGHPVLVEWFSGNPDAITITRITWMDTSA